MFRQRVREGERKGEKHQGVVASHTPPARNPAHNPGMCPNWASNQLPSGSHSSAQSVEPYQPGQKYIIRILIQIALNL